MHLLGKDNSWFHCVYWPAFLKSAGYDLPKTIFVHGFLSVNGQKISKSLGNVISPKYLAEKYGADTVRYFVCRQFPFSSGDDGDFSEQALIDRHNNELADKLGNLVSRVSALAEKYGVEKCELKLIKKFNEKKIEKQFDSFEFDKVLNELFGFVDSCNEFIQEKKPWVFTLSGNGVLGSRLGGSDGLASSESMSRNKKILYELVESIKKIIPLIWVFMPSTAEKIKESFCGEKIVKGKILFEKIKI